MSAHSLHTTGQRHGTRSSGLSSQCTPRVHCLHGELSSSNGVSPPSRYKQTSTPALGKRPKPRTLVQHHPRRPGFRRTPVGATSINATTAGCRSFPLFALASPSLSSRALRRFLCGSSARRSLGSLSGGNDAHVVADSWLGHRWGTFSSFDSHHHRCLPFPSRRACHL